MGSPGIGYTVNVVYREKCKGQFQRVHVLECSGQRYIIIRLKNLWDVESSSTFIVLMASHAFSTDVMDSYSDTAGSSN